MERKAWVADGSGLNPVPILDPNALLRAVDLERAAEHGWTLVSGTKTVPGWEFVLRSQLYLACGCSMEEAARWSNCSHTSVRRLLSLHGTLMRSDASCCDRATRVVGGLIQREYG